MTINEMQDAIIEDFSLFDDWFDKYTYLISMSNELPPMSVGIRTEQNRIKECQGKLWISASYYSGGLQVEADSDILIVKAILYLIISVLSGHEKEEVDQAVLYFIKEIGLDEHIDKNRANGLNKAVQIIKSAI